MTLIFAENSQSSGQSHLFERQRGFERRKKDSW